MFYNIRIVVFDITLLDKSGLLILVFVMYMNRLIILYINKRKRREKRIRIALIAKVILILSQFPDAAPLF